MNDAQFQAIRAEIDGAIDGLPDVPTGIKMGFGLAGEFLARNLLTTKLVDMILWTWEMRAYRDRYIYPDPMLSDYEYQIGDPTK